MSLIEDKSLLLNNFPHFSQILFHKTSFLEKSFKVNTLYNKIILY